MNYKSPKSKSNIDNVSNVSMKDIKNSFVNFVCRDKLGNIANAHLARADYLKAGASHKSCIQLAKLHSDAVDFPKTGIHARFPSNLQVSKFPDFMEKSDKPSYTSEKVLGVLYRSIEVKEFELYNNSNFDERLYVEGYEEYLDNARMLKLEYDAHIRRLMNKFGIMIEFEVISGYIVDTAVTTIDKKRPRDVVKSVMDAFIPIKRQYRKLFEEEFYDKGTNIISQEACNKMESKAYAWYYVTYHPTESGDKNMISFPWILHDILCDIALKNNCKRINRKNEPIMVSVKQKADNIVKQNDDINDDIEKLKQLLIKDRNLQKML